MRKPAPLQLTPERIKEILAKESPRKPYFDSDKLVAIRTAFSNGQKEVVLDGRKFKLEFRRGFRLIVRPQDGALVPMCNLDVKPGGF